MNENSDNFIEMMSVKNTFRAFRHWPRIFLLIWETKKTFFVSIIILNILSGLAPISILLSTQLIINGIVNSSMYGFQVVLWPFIFFISTSLLTEVIQIALGYLDNMLRMLLSNHINILIMKKTNTLSLADFEDAAVQDQLNRAQGEAVYRPYQIFLQILLILKGIVTLISASIVLISWKWWIIIIILVIPFLSFSMFLKLSQKEFFIHWNRTPKNRMLWYISYLLTKDISFKEIKLFQLEEHFLKQYKRLFQDFYTEDKNINQSITKLSFLLQGINQVIIGLIVLLILRTAYIGQILVGNVFGLIHAIVLTQSSAQSVVGSMLSLCQNNLYLEQLFSFLDIKVSDSQGDKSNSSEQNIHSLNSIHTIEFKNVSFKYAGSNMCALKNINLKLSAGRTYAIVGRNGSGKSTLIKLMTLLYNDFEGEIHINGISIKEFPIEMLRKKIGIIFQDFVQYEMSFRQNIGYGAIELIDKDEIIHSAADRAGLKELIKKLPSSIDTQLGRWFEGGQQLSGGQWQRIAIGRLFMRNADLYIMDEPSSFLDAQAEEEVFQRFEDLTTNKIGIFISHRLSSVRFADEIIVMENGSVVEHGSHETLLTLNNLYTKLYNLQKSGYDFNTHALPMQN